MKSLNEYIRYVHTTLESIPEGVQVVASYDTGYGLSLVTEYLGDEPPTVVVVANRVAKIDPPDMKIFNNGNEWDEAWDYARRTVRDFIAKGRY